MSLCVCKCICVCICTCISMCICYAYVYVYDMYAYMCAPPRRISWLFFCVVCLYLKARLAFILKTGLQLVQMACRRVRAESSHADNTLVCVLITRSLCRPFAFAGLRFRFVERWWRVQPRSMGMEKRSGPSAAPCERWATWTRSSVPSPASRAGKMAATAKKGRRGAALGAHGQGCYVGPARNSLYEGVM